MSDERGTTEHYLAQVRRALSPLPKRDADDLVAELRSHLDEACAQSDDVAVAKVLSEMGEPRDLARRMLAERIAGAGLSRVPLSTRAVACVVDIMLIVGPLLVATLAVLVVAGGTRGVLSARHSIPVVVDGALAAAWLLYLLWYSLRARNRDFRTPGRVLLGLTTTVENGRRRVAYEAEAAALSGEAPMRDRRTLMLVAALAVAAPIVLVLLILVSLASFSAGGSTISGWSETGGAQTDRLTATIDGFYGSLLHRNVQGVARYMARSAEPSATGLVREANDVVFSRYIVHWGDKGTSYVWERVVGDSLEGPGSDRWRLATLSTTMVAGRELVSKIVRSRQTDTDPNGQDIPDVLRVEEDLLSSVSMPGPEGRDVRAPGFLAAGGKRFLDENSGKTSEWQDGPVARIDRAGTHGWSFEITALGPNNKPKARWRVFFEDTTNGRGPLASSVERFP